MAFVHSSDVKDPTGTRYAATGCSTLEIMTVVPNAREWGAVPTDLASHAYRNDAAYIELKERLTDILVDARIASDPRRVATRAVAPRPAPKRATR